MKQQKSVEDYLHLADTALLPVLTRGLMSKTERVQAEFIEILLETALEDGRLGNIVNISSLRNNTDDPGELLYHWLLHSSQSFSLVYKNEENGKETPYLHEM